MQVECAQLGSTIWHLLAPKTDIVDFVLCIMPAIYAVSHPKHPVVLWGMQSLAHYMAIVELGIQLNVEKQRRIANMVLLPKALHRNWSMLHKSQVVLQFLKAHPPPLSAFERGDEWSDPPPCMPDYYKTDDNGVPRNVVTCYRLYYAGTKLQITKLKWLPYADEPPWLNEMKLIIDSSDKIRNGLTADVAKFNKESAKRKARKKGQEVDGSSKMTRKKVQPKRARIEDQ